MTLLLQTCNRFSSENIADIRFYNNSSNLFYYGRACKSIDSISLKSSRKVIFCANCISAAAAFSKGNRFARDTFLLKLRIAISLFLGCT